MEFSEILYDKKDGVATVTINRPEKYNACTPVTLMEIGQAFTSFRAAVPQPSLGKNHRKQDVEMLRMLRTLLIITASPSDRRAEDLPWKKSRETGC